MVDVVFYSSLPTNARLKIWFPALSVLRGTYDVDSDIEEMKMETSTKDSEESVRIYYHCALS